MTVIGDWLAEVLNLPTLTTPATFGLSEALDVFIVGCLLYLLFRWIKRTQAWTLFKGLLILSTIYVISRAMNLTTVLWIMESLFAMGLLVIVILFAPDFRRILEQIGRRDYIGSFTGKNESDHSGFTSPAAVNEIIKAAKEMAAVKTGALIVLEREVDLSEHESRGVPLGADISSTLLLSIFNKEAPLHDGAVIIRKNKMAAAACHLLFPSTELAQDLKDLGTRHRAAVSVSEASDARAVVVSEETGRISIAIDGQLRLDVNEHHLRELLNRGLPKGRSRLPIFGGKNKKEDS